MMGLRNKDFNKLLTHGVDNLLLFLKMLIFRH